MKRILPLLCTAALLTGCGAADTPGDARKTAAVISGDDKIAAADNPQCQLFTPAEIAAFAGEPVKPGANGAGGLSCNWKAADGVGIVIVTVSPAEYHVETSGAPGYRALPGVGKNGFVAGTGTSFTAATLDGDKAIFTNIDTSGATEAKAIALLQQIMARTKA